MIIPDFNQVSYGKMSLRTFDAKLWNSLPYHIKSSENLESFKRIIKHRNGERYLCKVCNCINKLVFRFDVDILFLLKFS